jgi:type IX secretion system PorP/SprF family membrane protein
MMQRITTILEFNRLLLAATVLLFSLTMKAQQEWSYTQYQFNLYDANSAYAGNHQTLSMAVRHRSQWIGFEGAPATDQFSMHAPVAGSRLGIGMRVVSDRIGARRQQMLKSSVAYKIPVANGTFSLALTAGLLRGCIDRNELTAQDMNDTQLAQLGAVQLTPMAGAAFLYSANRFFFGAEAGALNQSTMGNTAGSLARLYRRLNAVAGYIFPVGEADLLELSTQLKWSEGMQWQAEVNAQYLYHNKCWLGAGYRANSAWQLLAAWMVNEQFRIGLSYDNTVSRLLNSNQSSAELFLGYTLHKRSAGAVRYF